MRILFDTNIVLDIINRREPFYQDSFDAVQSMCARRNRVRYIVTRNTKDYALSEVMAVEPRDFLLQVAHAAAF